MDHLEENTIIGYVGGNLADDDRRRVEEHIDTCPSCRQTLAVVGGDSGLVTPYAGAVQSIPSPQPSDDDSAFADMPVKGDRIADRFTIVRLLGRGGMGYVFQATDDDLGITVALKVLRPELTHDEEQVRHLRREILAGRKITHANVCRVFDLGKGERLHFITMEYVSGGTIADRLRAGPVPPTEAIALLQQLLSALATAHAEGIVHRDLKPANLMLDANGKLKVMDFGLARDLKGEHSLKGHVGTPAYWSPEQARGEAAGPASDLYTVGLLAYMLLSGEQSTRRARQRLTRVPPRFRPWVERCLDEDIEKRFPDAASAAAALDELREAPGTRRYLLGGLAALGAALAIAGGWWALSSRGGDGKAEPQVATAASADAASPRVEPPDAPAVAAAADAAVLPVATDAAIDAAPPPDAAARKPPVDAAARMTPDAAVSPPADAPAAAKPDAGSLLYEP